MGWKRVARSAGLSPSTVWKLIYGDPSRGQVPSKRVRPATAEKLLAVELDLAAGAIVPSIGTARRIQALVAIGWSQSKIAAQIGMNRSNFGPLAHGRRDVTAGTAAAVRKIYDELSMTPAPVSLVHERSSVSRSLRFAAVAGWVTPLAWDDDTIDDPAAVPQVGAPARRDLVEDYDWLVENGESRWSALQILGVTQSAIDHARRRQTAAA
ncbi:hypothetical protein HMPREF0063_11941 [Aeromicrobium marinum DSM 15272]|uniref:Uncharacterized protein n=2 Tax=Aeromicrobium marinum TaxID=219314 RepID=E2SE05_9ACTN|nr:hypothetical protein HMPREF0063_11941 [Aeromicrobium marinum DSM 15272]